MSDRIYFYTQGGSWENDRSTWASDVETWAGDMGYLSQAPGPDGPTYFIRLGGENITPRAAGDLIIDPNVAAIDWSTGWVYPTLLNGWSNYNPDTHVVARYRRGAGNVVTMEGLVKGGAIPSTVCMMPEGYRVKYRLIMPTLSVDNTGCHRVDVTQAHELRPVTGASGWVSLQIQYYADL